MKDDPVKGDWIHLVQSDMRDIDLNMSDDLITTIPREEFKKIVKDKVRKLVYKDLEQIKQKHIKVKHIVHENMDSPQKYLTSPLLNNKQSSLLLNLRSHCVNEFKSNFYTCNCPLCGKSEDTQGHAIVCETIRKHMDSEHKKSLESVTYMDIYSDPLRQHLVTQVFSYIIQTRERLRTENKPTTAS